MLNRPGIEIMEILFDKMLHDIHVHARVRAVRFVVLYKEASATDFGRILLKIVMVDTTLTLTAIATTTTYVLVVA